MLYNKYFTDQLTTYYNTEENLSQREQKKEVNIKVAKFLAKIYSDFEYEGFEYLGIETLGDLFTEKHTHCGIFNVYPSYLITFSRHVFELFDDKIVVKSIYSDSQTLNEEAKALSSKKYQERYVKEMYKMFGEPYKKHYIKLINEKRQKLDEQEAYVK